MRRFLTPGCKLCMETICRNGSFLHLNFYTTFALGEQTRVNEKGDRGQSAYLAIRSAAGSYKGISPKIEFFNRLLTTPNRYFGSRTAQEGRTFGNFVLGDEFEHLIDEFSLLARRLARGRNQR